MNPSICKQEFRAVVSKECLSVRVCWLVSNGKSRGQILLVREDEERSSDWPPFSGRERLGWETTFLQGQDLVWCRVAKLLPSHPSLSFVCGSVEMASQIRELCHLEALVFGLMNSCR